MAKYPLAAASTGLAVASAATPSHGKLVVNSVAILVTLALNPRTSTILPSPPKPSTLDASVAFSPAVSLVVASLFETVVAGPLLDASLFLGGLLCLEECDGVLAALPELGDVVAWREVVELIVEVRGDLLMIISVSSVVLL